MTRAGVFMVSTCLRGLPAPLGSAVEHVGCPHFSGAGSLLGEHGAAPHLQGDWLPLLRGLEVQVGPCCVNKARFFKETQHPCPV